MASQCSQRLKLADKDFKSAFINMCKELQKTLFKEHDNNASTNTGSP